MLKKSVFTLVALFSIGCGISFAQISVNRDSILFNPTNEIQLDSARLVIHNNSTQEISITTFRFFNTYSAPAFFVKALADSTISAADSLVTFVYFKPRHNIFHNSELLVETIPNAYSFTIDLRGQGKYSIPYYAATENKSEEDLKASLKTIISAGYVSLGYNLARDNMFMTIDNQKTNGQGASVNTLDCIYTGKKSLAYTSRTESQTNDNFNTEHTFPQGYFSQNEPMRSDLHHLFPTNDAANNSRSNYAFGVATTPYVNDATNTPSHLGANTLYEPRDVQKGRTARAMMYFVLRYQDYTNFFVSQETILRKWNTDFPPNAIDKKRNTDILLVQKNRNPFVDYPQYAERITKLVAPSTTPVVQSIYKLDSIITYSLNDTTDSVIINYPIVNNGNKSVLIQNPISTNSLVDFRFDSVRLAPGESINLPIVIHTKDTAGTFQTGLQFYTDYSLIFLYSRLSFSITKATQGIEHSVKNNKLQVFPNPVGSSLYLVPCTSLSNHSAQGPTNTLGQMSLDFGPCTLDYAEFYALDGKLVLTAPIVDNSIDVTELLPGFYTLKTSAGYAKIIKQ